MILFSLASLLPSGKRRGEAVSAIFSQLKKRAIPNSFISVDERRLAVPRFAVFSLNAPQTSGFDPFFRPCENRVG